MLYSVKQISTMAHVTVKTLHHYHKIGLLIPCQITEAGYRLYGQKELERLQQILFYRELDFSLQEIASALDEEGDRVEILSRQRALLAIRMKRLGKLIRTLDETIDHSRRNDPMASDELFAGFSETEWKEALKEQSAYLKEKYAFDLVPEGSSIQAERMNESANEVIHFQGSLAQALRDGRSAQDEVVQGQIADHLAYLNDHGNPMDKQAFARNAHFLVGDDFHRKMLEGEQIGLAYYYLAAVEHFERS